MKADGRNAGQVEFWNGPTGRRWVERQAEQDALLAPITAALLARAAVRPGERVVDIGCGCGETAIEFARRVLPGGSVLGIDISAPMLAHAATRVEPGLPVTLVQGDATTYPFAEGAFDLLASRLGVMFFAEPERAFANLRRALRPGGRLVFVCFRAPRDNPWIMLPLNAAYEHVPPLPKMAPEDPGPFAYANDERLRRILASAGFSSIGLDRLDVKLDLAGGRGLDAAIEAALTMGPAARAIEGQPPAARDAVQASMRRVLASHRQGDTVPLTAAFWLVSASP
ncbi:MAG TPA: methyltransferase domain-containing protein [Stellaceae bacterium]|nr:methyltransferase domain-containing protein [Stellaceae bacterium]